MKTKVLLISFLILNIFQVSAQNNDEVTLIVSADGATKEEATLSALRSAIEQTYGAFVSANTQVLNDELVKDDIVTISNGNIKKYEVITHSTLPNGNQFVTLNATVSVSKVISYAQSKGILSVDFAGATFAMNIKMEELYKKNEKIAIDNMIHQLSNFTNSIPDLFDLELSLKEPYLSRDEQIVHVGGVILFKPNANTQMFRKIMMNTFLTISSNLDMTNGNKWGGFLCSWANRKDYDIITRNHLQFYFFGKIRDIIKNYVINSKWAIKANTGEIFVTITGTSYSDELLIGALDDRIMRFGTVIYKTRNGIQFECLSEGNYYKFLGLSSHTNRDQFYPSFDFDLEIPKDRIGDYSKFELVNLAE